MLGNKSLVSVFSCIDTLPVSFKYIEHLGLTDAICPDPLPCSSLSLLCKFGLRFLLPLLPTHSAACVIEDWPARDPSYENNQLCFSRYGSNKEIAECPGYWPFNAHARGFWFLPMACQFYCDKYMVLSGHISSYFGGVEFEIAVTFIVLLVYVFGEATILGHGHALSWRLG
ncbi:uncharacterized protein [Miscanthus floridulus]|uniref:uncharacterized protein n=1 Tax=Miscanthus floridulus TaxID=154761 RepID=UPI00345AFA1F